MAEKDVFLASISRSYNKNEHSLIGIKGGYEKISYSKIFMFIF